MEIKNATTVHRVWRTLDDAELIATFQYGGDADVYCRAAIEMMPDGTHLIHVCHRSGKMTIVRKQPEVQS